MKKLLVFVLMLSPVILSAQTRSFLINRIDREDMNKIESAVAKQEIVVRKEVGGDKVLLNQAPLANGKSFDIAMTTTVIKFNAGNLATIHGAITNLTKYAVQIIFNRTHLRLPQDWTSSVCFGQNCFSATTDSIPPENAFVLDPGVMGDFVLNIYDADPFMGEDSVVDYIRFTAVASDEGDTLAYILKGVLEAPSGVQDNQPKPASGSPKIMTIYPSPLVQGSSIKVKVSSPRESNLSYSIYDALGREVALGVTRQHIGLGDNTVSIGSLDGLGNGSYMLKFNFGDGSSDTHFFQVLK